MRTTYYIRAIDSLGNSSEYTGPYVIMSDRTAPQVVITPHNSDVYAKNYTVSVKVNDIPTLNAQQNPISGFATIKYLWSNESTGISESNFDQALTFTLDKNNEATITTDANLTGRYYAIIQ